MVVAIPPPLVVQGDDEEVGAFQIGKGGLAVGRAIAQNGIAQGRTQAVEEGGVEEEGLDGGGLLVQHFFDEVIQHKVVAPREGVDEVGRLFVPLLALHGEGGQLQTRNPPFGACFEGGNFGGREG